MSNSSLRHFLSGAATVLILLPLAGCASLGDMAKPTEQRAKDMAMYDFSSDIRWNDWDAAYDFVDPKTKLEHPLTPVDSARFKQVEVAGYDIVSSLPGQDTIDQQVKLQLINRNTQVPRTIVYREHWRWDSTDKRWWLTTGLPDITSQE
jgi:hypothetical protein